MMKGVLADPALTFRILLRRPVIPFLSSVAWAFALLLTTACGDASGPEPAVTSRDSAGVDIVESRRPAWGSGKGWSLSPTPVLTLGGREAPGHDLYRVRSALRLDDGRVVVADAGSAELRFFGGDGRLVRVAGGRGGGPGEYRFLSLVTRLGRDSLLVWDSRTRRLTVTNLDGVSVRTTKLDNTRYQARLTLADGTVLSSDVRRASPPVGTELPIDVVVRPTRDYAIYSSEGTRTADLGEWPDNEAWSSFDVDHSHVQELLFGRRTVLAAGKELFWIGTGETYELRGYDRAGKLARIVRNLAHEPLRPTPTLVSGRIAELQVHWGEETQHMLPVYRAQATPAVAAPFDQLAVDAEGNLWVRGYPIPGEAFDAWMVFDAGGRLLGPVAVPHRLEILDIGGDFVLGKSVDSMNVERIEVYGLVRS